MMLGKHKNKAASVKFAGNPDDIDEYLRAIFNNTGDPIFV